MIHERALKPCLLCMDPMGSGSGGPIPESDCLPSDIRLYVGLLSTHVNVPVLPASL